MKRSILAAAGVVGLGALAFSQGAWGDPASFGGGSLEDRVDQLEMEVASLRLWRGAVEREKDASRSTMLLADIREAVERYREEHKGYPVLSRGWGQLTERTDVHGNVTARGEFGPYLETEPVNPFNGATSVAPLGDGGTRVGWFYDMRTGEVRVAAPERARRVLTEWGVREGDVVGY